ncbi:HDOD domain-containing protein [Dechloromonas sp. XY25]|uniref:HDOD domain-containing protein n=1 Tax=Dechloromonas hankyongensis TaxID=2908002 RepID=A0ABS9K422_9RHOO|nr:HDOD domain-containing protein [Dechloromonas hankyongensis]MCG2577900.1 HDOD domain-containing protein [Dechloromonas hankyongensis]
MNAMTEHGNDPDKKGEALKAQRFQMLEDIARELSGEVVFPTYFDAVLRLRKALQDPELSIDRLSRVIATEPLISAKLLHLANSVAFNPGGNQILDLKSAIMRLGLNVVHTTALSIVMTQLMRAKGMAEFAEITHSLWEHSIQTSAAAYVLAKDTGRLNRDEAMLAGLVHDLGAFYMLYRATQYDELRHRPDTIKHLIIQWHESIGVSLLDALGLPVEIVEATIDHDHLRNNPTTLRSLPEVVYAANMLSGGHIEWLMQDQPSIAVEIAALETQYGHLRADIEALAAELRGSFA